MSETPNPVSGWYEDPERQGGERFWDGQQWTEHRREKTAPAPGDAEAGSPVVSTPGIPPVAALPSQTNGFATAALVLGIIGLLFAWIPIIGIFGLLLGILALTFGVLGRRNVGRGISSAGQGMATSGVVMGVIAVLLFGLFTVAPLVIFAGFDEVEVVFESCPDGSLALVGEC